MAFNKGVSLCAWYTEPWPKTKLMSPYYSFLSQNPAPRPNFLSTTSAGHPSEMGAMP